MKLKFLSVSLFVALCLFGLTGFGSLPAQAQQFGSNVLYSFTNPGGEGWNPQASLIMDASGNLYGTTVSGGTSNYGTVFELVNSSGVYTEKVLYSFAGPPYTGGDGAYPYASLVMDASGNLYGTTYHGGTSGYGTVFELVNSAGTYTEQVLYSFTDSGGDGAYPEAALIMDASGNLYGTTPSGGASGEGTVFEMVNYSGSYTERVLYSFAGSSGDGAYPEAALIMDASGNFYGTTGAGGASAAGTVFELVNSSGSYTERVLYSFTGSSGDGAYPSSALLMDASGNLYGTTPYGGVGYGGGDGTAFELVNSSGSYTETVLHIFTGSGADGANPSASLTMDASRNLYGTTINGGADNDGTVFELVSSAGTYAEQVLHSFTGTGGDGSRPEAGLIKDGSGNLYGTTLIGGAGTSGTVFELINYSGTYTEQVLHGFAYSGDGANPEGGLVMDASGNLYGTTVSGGPSNYGTVFELVNSSGTYTERLLYSFTGSNGDGAIPVASLIIDESSNLYGTTYDGGASGEGTVFELVNSSGTYTEQVLYSFTGSLGDGARPATSLVRDASGNLYGTTINGGTDNYGTVFELANSSGNYTEQVLYSFTDSGGDGAYPDAGLVMDASGDLYGTTVNGGADNYGTVFELVNSSGSYTERVLYSFTDSGGDGANSEAGLIMDTSGNLYGTTLGGGTDYDGTLFELANSSGTYAERVLYAFTGYPGDGAFPFAGMTMDTSGNLYGTTERGGVDNVGIAFELVNSSGTYTEQVQHTFTGSGGDGARPSAGLITDASGNLYGTTQQGGTNNYGTVFELVNETTSLSVSSNLSFSTYGQTVTFTATINGASGQEKRRSAREGVRSDVVTGMVTWSANTGCGTTPVTSGNPGTATCTTSSLPAGSDTVTADYSGDSNNGPSSGSTIQVVNLASTTINVTGVSPSSEAYGQDAAVTITAVLSWTGGGATPTASNVTIGGNGLSGYGATSCGSPNGNTLTCTATYTPTNADAVASYTESAMFSGDSNYAASSSPQTNNFTITSATSSTSVSSSLNPSSYTQSVTFTATIDGEYGASRGAASRRKNGVRRQDVTGTVTWTTNTGCGPTPVTSGNPGTATCTTSSLPVGSDTITATYSGDSNHGGSAGTLTGGQTVNQASQMITWTTPPPATAGYNTNFTVAATASSGLPVTYTSAGHCTNSGPTYTITAPKGICSMQVNQSGNIDYLPAHTLTANVTATKATLVASFTGAPASAVYGATFTVTATANSGATPTFSALGACTISGTTVTMTSGIGTCTTVATWVVSTDYYGLRLTQKTEAELITPTVSFTGAPSTATDGTQFAVTATSNESGSNAAVPTITGSGSCTAGTVSNSGPGSYQATITITKNSGTCTTTAKWAKTIEYAAETLTQKTTAEK